MPKASKGGYYAVAVGRTPGIYTSWADVQPLITGFSNAMQQKFPTMEKAQDYMNKYGPKHLARTSAASSEPSGNPSRAGTRPGGTTGRLLHSTSPETPLQTTQTPASTEDVVYTDGACSNNGKGIGYAVAGVGVWFGPSDPRNISERCPGMQTNNRAELIAIIRVLEVMPYSARPLVIKTDSKYSIQAAYEWIPKWVALDKWVTSTGQPVKNEALLRYLGELLRLRSLRKHIVRLQHVRGHVGIPGNEAADLLARTGTLLPAVDEVDWDERRASIEAQADGELTALGDASRDVQDSGPVLVNEAALPDDAEVNDDDWDFDDDVLDMLDPPRPAS